MDNKKYPVVEIFQSIQGEGQHMGMYVNFVRFAGCNLKCPWCDTDWSKPTLGMLTAEEIFNKLDHSIPTVFTGGEPLLQDLESLIAYIRTKCIMLFAVETNGTQSTRNLASKSVWITCSPKPETGWKIHPECAYDEIKYVIDDKITLKDIPYIPNCPVWLQPEGYHMQESWKKCMSFVEQNHRLRVGVQLHKIMEVR